MSRGSESMLWDILSPRSKTKRRKRVVPEDQGDDRVMKRAKAVSRNKIDHSVVDVDQGRMCNDYGAGHDECDFGQTLRLPPTDLSPAEQDVPRDAAKAHWAVARSRLAEVIQQGNDPESAYHE